MRVKEINIQFEVKRPSRKTKWMHTFFITAFFLFFTVVFVYIPYITYQEDILIIENVNQNLTDQLTRIEAEQSANNQISLTEVSYNNIYQYLQSNDTSIAPYLENIFSNATSQVTISKFSIDSVSKTIQITISNSTDYDINEYLLQLYENYGVIPNSENELRWIVSSPLIEKISSVKTEVTFTYA